MPYLKQRIDQVEDFTLNVLKNLTTQVKSLEAKLNAIQSMQEKQQLQIDNLSLQQTNQRLEIKLDQQNATIQQLESQTSVSHEKEPTRDNSGIQAIWGSPIPADNAVQALQAQISELRQQINNANKQNTLQLEEKHSQFTVQLPELQTVGPSSPFSIKQQNPILSSQGTPATQPSSLSYTYPEMRESNMLPKPQPEPMQTPTPDLMKTFFKQLKQEAQSAYDYASKLHAQIALVSLQLDDAKPSPNLIEVLKKYVGEDQSRLENAFGFLKTSPFVASPVDALKRFITVRNSPCAEIDVGFPLKELSWIELEYITAQFEVVNHSCFNYGLLTNTGVIRAITGDKLGVFDIVHDQNQILIMLKSQSSAKTQQLTLQQALIEFSDELDVIVNADVDFALEIFSEKQIRHLQLRNKAITGFDRLNMSSITSLTLQKCICPDLRKLNSLRALMMSDVAILDGDVEKVDIQIEKLEFLSVRWAKSLSVRLFTRVVGSRTLGALNLKYLEVYESELPMNVEINVPELRFLILQYNKQHLMTKIDYQKTPLLLFVSLSSKIDESGVRPAYIHLDAGEVVQKWVT